MNTTLMLEFPFIIYLNPDGTIGYSQNVYDYDTLSSSKIDIWVVNHISQFSEISKLHRLFLINNQVEKIHSAKLSQLRQGTQILYLPSHLTNKADLMNKEVQFGFVTSKKQNGTIYCRYFSQYDLRTLRTLSCSEQSPIQNLYVLNTVEKEVVKTWISYIDNEEKRIAKMIEDQEPWVRTNR